MDVQAFLDTLPYMAKGMLGIFVVIGLLMLVTVLLNKLTAQEKD